uniref:protein EARLY FLOWERING 3-like n=1 Tax=Erigeron canadensis TaxID=72917 RepID=UPI001CB97EC9|nr:protein EARLY FLOWERING 3-like [Erigeron canadensis]
MGNVKDDGKKLMDPLFPRLHISDAEKGGPRTPPRNKMAISQQLNVSPSSQTTQRSMSRISPHSITNRSSLGPQSSSYHDASYKRSVFSSFGGRSTRMATRLDTYQSSGLNLNFSLTTTVKQTIETTNCQALCDTGHLKRGDYRLYKPLMRSHEEITDDYLIPCLCFGNDQNYTNRRKFPTLSTNRPDHTKHNPIVGPKLVELTDKDITKENKLNTTLTITDITDEEPLPCANSETVRVSEMTNGELMSPSDTRKNSISVEEPQTLHNMINIGLPLKRKSSSQENVTCKNGKIDSTSTDHEVVTPNNIDEEHAGKVGDVIETNFVSSNNIITPEEVSRMIGPEQYCIIRRAIIQQQKAFQSQVFELHKLIKVQKVLAGSPGLLREDSSYKLKRTPFEDIFPQVDQHKKESLFTIPIDGTIKKTNHTNFDTDKRYYPSLIDLHPPPPAPSVINGSKPSPWCYLPPPPPGNQWLVPVRSPSEGLVYKPYTGPSPPPVAFMTPVYGMSLTLPSVNSEFLTTTTCSPYNNNIPPSNYYQQGINLLPSSTPLFTSYGFPTISSSKNYSCSPMIIENDVNYSKTTTTCNNLLTGQDNKESDLQGSSGSNYSCERVKDELPLFPTTPMLHETNHCIAQKGQVDERIKVIKVVPHNPKLASESAARIFQFIQEERKHNE